MTKAGVFFFILVLSFSFSVAKDVSFSSPEVSLIEVSDREELKVEIKDQLLEAKLKIQRKASEEKFDIKKLEDMGGRSVKEFKINVANRNLRMVLDEKLLNDSISREIRTTFEDGEVISVFTSLRIRKIDESSDDFDSIILQLKNREVREFKIFPDVASNIAKNEFGLDDFSLELVEEESIKDSKILYQVSSLKKGKLLGLINTDLEVNGMFDANTGEVINLDKPWWSFLVSEN